MTIDRPVSSRRDAAAETIAARRRVDPPAIWSPSTTFAHGGAA